jgi:translation initiation factor IF-3
LNTLNYKIKQAREFITSGKHVRFRVFLKGHEMSNPDAGAAVLENVWKLMQDIAERDKEPNFEGRYVNMLTTPKR